ncbi:MAG: uroporphyrinogen-III C-methyltransferase [Bacteroidia bacterium]|nr:uroporphyrinogen-III C-methyltransferase [Bacteroidia bacterium]
MKTITQYPKLTVVGAGPGDPLLLTIKAVHAINEADVILYDALVNKEILKHARFDIPKIFVGKRKGQHSLSQDEINQLIISFAYTHGHVVRLKGGDPFVFGRGKEEINFAESFNIETDYVPGISSSIGVAGLAGIPVTHRGSSESFWVITGTTKKNNLSEDVVLAAKTKATVVILMGLNKISEIAEVFRKAGKENTPIAIIQNGATNGENHFLGTIDTIEEIIKDNLDPGPGIIVIGEVVKQHPDFPLALPEWKYLLN